MTVVFDGTALGEGPITGVARAFWNGLAAYLPIADAPPRLLLPPHCPPPDLPIDIVPAPTGRWRRQWQLPRLLRRLAASVLHSPVAAVPLRAPCPTIATLHDLPWLSPESGERTGAWRRFATIRSVRSAAAVLAPSTFTRTAAQTLVDPTRLHLVPNASPLPPPAPLAPRDGPLLMLGDSRPRKNRERLQRAWELARTTAPGLPPLRLCGPPDAWLDERDKTPLLRRCAAVVQFSLFEGFGLPVLEGLAHGAPVACADIPPFREIAGDAALFADPRDVDAIAAALRQITSDQPLRARLQQRGPERAAAFTPERTAARWLTLHRQLQQ
ncbi:MAG: glycosyltransferase family 4 protein [Planctomycetes bacterium]|nr:glycosyltransferase family 4 protein [Planctomycetota bacterium]